MTSHGGTNDKSSTSHGDAAHTSMPGYIQPSLFGDGDIIDIDIMSSATNPDVNRRDLHGTSNIHSNTSNTISASNSNISPNGNTPMRNSHSNLSNLSNFSNFNNLSNLNTPVNCSTPNNLNNFNNSSSGNNYSQMDDFGFDLKNDQYDYFSQVSLSAPSSRIEHVYGLELGEYEKAQQRPQGTRQQLQGQQILQQPLPLPQYGQNIQSQVQIQNQGQQLSSPEQRQEQEFQNYRPRSRLNNQHSLSQEVVDYPTVDGYQPKRKHSNENDTSVSAPTAPGTGTMAQLPYPPKPPTIRQNSLPVPQKAATHNHKKNHGANDLSFFGYSNNVQMYGNKNTPNSGNSQNVQIPQTIQNQYNSSSYNEIDVNTSQKTDATVSLGSPSETKKSKSAPNPRGRPRKNRNPGFFLPLDNLNTKNQLAKVASNSISSSHSDTAAYNWNRTERVNNNSGTRNFSANIPLFKDDGQHTPNPELRLFEADMGLQDDGLQRFAPSNSNITPSMNPPLNVNGYFELGNHNQSRSINSNSNSQFDTSSLLTHFISPHINYNELTYNNFNKEFEDYLTETGTGSNVSQQRPVSGQYQLINKAHISMSRGVPVENDHEDLGFGADLGGFNFDVNPRNELLDPESLLKPTAYDNNELVSTSASSMLNPTPIYDDNDILSVNQHGATSLSQSSANGSDFESSESDRESKPSGHLDVRRPVIVRSISDHSGNSNSNSSPPQEFRHDDNDILIQKPKKKRLPKGAVCSICDKYISRDLTRHMRIHNEVGRFQCVYPKYMCNHKTQYFNRPYDYKKHLLHMHFRFDDPKGKTANTLTDKLPLEGICIACGARFVANDWLETHVLTNSATKCPSLENRE